MQSASAIFNRVLTQNKIKRIRRDNPTGLWLEMKECLCSFLSEASVFPHSSDSGMSRWVGTCRQTAPRAPRSGRGARCVSPCLTLLFPSGFWVSGLRCQLHPCLGVAWEPRRRSAARTRASTRGTLSRLLCVCGSGRGIQHRLRHPGCAMGNLPSAAKHCLSYHQLLREHLWSGESVAGALDPAQVLPRGLGRPHPLVQPLPYQPHPNPLCVISVCQDPACSSSVVSVQLCN